MFRSLRNFAIGGSIRGRAGRILLLTGLVPLAAVTMYIVFGLRVSIANDGHEALETEATQQAGAVASVVKRAQTNIGLLAANPVLADPAADADAKLQQLRQAEDFFDVFEDITLVAPDGNVMNSTSYSYDGAWENNEAFATALESGAPAESDPRMARSPSRLVVEFAAPVLSDGVVGAVVVGRMNMDQVWAVTDATRIGETGFIAVFDRHGNFIAHPDKDLILTLGLAPHEVSGQDGGAAGHGEQHIAINGIDGKPAEGTTADVGFGGWEVAAAQNPGETNALADEALLTSVLLVGIVVILTGIGSVVMSTAVTNPIGRLRLAMSAIAGGDLKSRLPQAELTEIDALSASFNQMAGDLEARTDEEQAARQALAASEEKFRALIHHSSDVINVLEPDGVIKFVSPSAERVLGYPTSELIGTNAFHYMHPDDMGPILETFTLGISQPSEFADVGEFRFRHKDGSWRWLAAAGQNLLGEEAVRGVVINARDVTERHATEDALRASEHALREQNALLVTLARSEPLAQGHLEAALRQITEAAAQSLAPGKSAIWLMGQGRSKLVCNDFYDPDTRTHSSGGERDVAAYQQFFKALQDERTLAVSDTRSDPRTREFSSDPGLGDSLVESHLDAGIWLRGEIVGVLFQETTGLPREWTMEEQRFAGSLADIVSLALESSQRKQREEEAKYMAHHDALTNLPNRALLQDRVATAIKQAARRNESMAVLFLDLDNFKLVNDSLGHVYGDRLLQTATERILRVVRDADTAARVGGDEFALVLPNATCEEAISVTERLIKSLRSPVKLMDQEFQVTASVGIAMYPQDGDNVDALLRNADTAMYQAKGAGRDRYSVFAQEMSAPIMARVRMEGALRRAVERQEFVVYYQPRVEASTRAISGFEALVRWIDPERGLVPPDEFIPLAEETGLILPLGEWVMRESCRQAAEWAASGIGPFFVSVNISARQFQNPGLPNMIRSALAESGLPPELLEVEITEGTAMRDAEFTAETLNELRALGLRVSLDDFGTGYSSLSYLKRFPVDTVKIDRSFIRDTPRDSDDTAIVNAIIDLAASLGLSVTAEGVETEVQFDYLAGRRCHEIQGYLFSKPRPASEIDEMIGHRRTNRNQDWAQSRPVVEVQQ